MTYRIFRYESTLSRPADPSKGEYMGAYFWVGDASGFGEGTEFRPKGMSESESAIRFWFSKNKPSEGYYFAVPWECQPPAFTVEPATLVVE